MPIPRYDSGDYRDDGMGSLASMLGAIWLAGCLIAVIAAGLVGYVQYRCHGGGAAACGSVGAGISSF